MAVLQSNSFRISGEGQESRCFRGWGVVELSLASQCEALRVGRLGRKELRVGRRGSCSLKRGHLWVTASGASGRVKL